MNNIYQQQNARKQIGQEINARLLNNRTNESKISDDRLNAQRNARYERERNDYIKQKETEDIAHSRQVNLLKNIFNQFFLYIILRT